MVNVMNITNEIVKMLNLNAACILIFLPNLLYLIMCLGRDGEETNRVGKNQSKQIHIFHLFIIIYLFLLQIDIRVGLCRDHVTLTLSRLNMKDHEGFADTIWFSLQGFKLPALGSASRHTAPLCYQVCTLLEKMHMCMCAGKESW